MIQPPITNGSPGRCVQCYPPNIDPQIPILCRSEAVDHVIVDTTNEKLGEPSSGEKGAGPHVQHLDDRVEVRISLCERSHGLLA